MVTTNPQAPLADAFYEVHGVTLGADAAKRLHAFVASREILAAYAERHRIADWHDRQSREFKDLARKLERDKAVPADIQKARWTASSHAAHAAVIRLRQMPKQADLTNDWVAVPRKLLTEAHACMRACGWQLAPAAEDGTDGVLALAVADIEGAVADLLAQPPDECDR